jgi:hypothetical protein
VTAAAASASLISSVAAVDGVPSSFSAVLTANYSTAPPLLGAGEITLFGFIDSDPRNSSGVTIPPYIGGEEDASCDDDDDDDNDNEKNEDNEEVEAQKEEAEVQMKEEV